MVIGCGQDRTGQLRQDKMHTYVNVRISNVCTMLRVIIQYCFTFCSCNWALTTLYSGDGGFWLATISSVSANQDSRESSASVNFPDCNSALSRLLSRSDTWRMKLQKHIKPMNNIKHRQQRLITNEIVASWCNEGDSQSLFVHAATCEQSRPLLSLLQPKFHCF